MLLGVYTHDHVPDTVNALARMPCLVASVRCWAYNGRQAKPVRRIIQHLVANTRVLWGFITLYKCGGRRAQ